MTDSKEYLDLKKWFEETADERCEDMGAFFDARISGYEEHMSFWSEHYKRVAELVPQGARTLLDLGCGTGLELDRIYEHLPDIRQVLVDSVKLKPCSAAEVQKSTRALRNKLGNALIMLAPKAHMLLVARYSCVEKRAHILATLVGGLFKPLFQVEVFFRVGHISSFCRYRRKSSRSISLGSLGADTRIRTGDLILTKGDISSIIDKYSHCVQCEICNVFTKDF